MGDRSVLVRSGSVRPFATAASSRQQHPPARPLSTVAELTLNIIRELAPDKMKYLVDDPEQRDHLVMRIPSVTPNHLFSTENEEFLEIRCRFNETRKWHELVISWPVTYRKQPISGTELNIERIELVAPDGAPGAEDLTESVKRALAVIDAFVNEKTKVGRLVRMNPPFSFRVHDKGLHKSPSPQRHDVERQGKEGAPIKVHGKPYYVTMDPVSVDTVVSSKIVDAKERIEAPSIPPKHTVVVRSWKGHYDEITFPPNSHEFEDEWGKNISIE